ncbi:MAG: ATP-dependent DNA helicase RecG, partial [Acidimicrobiales bacterium]
MTASGVARPDASGAATTTGRRLAQLATVDVSVLSGVGKQRAAALSHLQVNSVLDLLMHYPRRYIDRTRRVAIRDLEIGEEAMVLGTVRRAASRRTRQGRTLVEVDVYDGASHLRCTFFNQPWRTRQLRPGSEVVLFGRLERFRDAPTMANPVVDLVGDRTGRIVAVYPQSEKAALTTWDLAQWVEEALQRAGTFADPLDAQLRDRLDLVDRTWAMRQIHRPDSMADIERARRRLVFDELLRLQLELVSRKLLLERDAKGIAHEAGRGELVARFHAGLGYQLTGAQRRAVAEILDDLVRPRP